MAQEMEFQQALEEDQVIIACRFPGVLLPRYLVTVVLVCRADVQSGLYEAE